MFKLLAKLIAVTITVIGVLAGVHFYNYLKDSMNLSDKFNNGYNSAQKGLDELSKLK